MFEAISFFENNIGNAESPIDIGALIECMLFYETTTVIANHGILKQLIRFFGIDRLLTLIDEGLLRIIYTESLVGIISRTIENIRYHRVDEASLPNHPYQSQLRRICIEVAGQSGKGRRLANKIQDKIVVMKHDHLILDGGKKAILDQQYIGSAAKIVIAEFVPEIGDVSRLSDLEFHTEETDAGIRVASNLNFSKLNSEFHKSISPESILVHVLELEKELFFSSTNLSEMSSSNLSSKLAEAKIDYILAKSNKSKETLSNFTGFLFKDAKAIREAVNLGRIDLDELMAVLQKSSRFKEWIVKVKPDANLIQNYYEEVTKKTILDRLPGKTMRWAIFTGLGIAADAMGTHGIGTSSGMALGALDNFYIDKLITGWRPSHFIEGDVKRLIEPSDG